MKIYKLDMDTAQPTRQVVVMQQNSLGLLSVDVERNDWPIRNLSCTLLDGDNEISACLSGESGAGFKLDVGEDVKAVKLVAKSTPIECSAQYVVSLGTGPASPKAVARAQLEAGTYRQDEFNGIRDKFADRENGIMTNFFVHADDYSNANFGLMVINPSRNGNELYFYTGKSAADKGDRLPDDALIVATGPVRIMGNVAAKRNPTISSYTYPAIGYYTDYTQEAVIRPSTNAPCWGERDFAWPEPEPEPEPEPTPEET